jgi:hypothetical protein
LTFDTLNRGRTVFFNGGNADNLYQNICFEWNLHHENISFRSKDIPINVLENTCPGFKPSPSKIDKQHTL